MLLNDAGLNISNLKSAISNNEYCIQQKIDGQRILVSVNDGKVTYYTRNGDVLLLKGGYHSYFAKYINCNYVFDGEFAGETLWLFDFIDLNKPKEIYKNRLEQLNSLINITKTVKILPTALTTLDKLSLTKSVIKNYGEGVVFKKLDKPYTWNKRIGYKFKFYNDIDAFVISEHSIKNSIEVGVFSSDKKTINLGSVKWDRHVESNDVFIIKYLYATPENKLYQPSIIRKRMDKEPKECLSTQLRYTNKEVLNYKKILDLTS